MYVQVLSCMKEKYNGRLIIINNVQGVSLWSLSAPPIMVGSGAPRSQVRRSLLEECGSGSETREL